VVAPSCHLPIHHRHNACAVILRNLLGPDAVSSLSPYCLDFRCPLGYPSHIHPSTPCRNIHISLTCIPHTVHSIKPRSAFQKSACTYTERTSLHLLDPVSPYLLRLFRFVVVVAKLLFLWDLNTGEEGENEVKSLLFIIVVIVYLQYLEERRSGKKEKKKEVFRRIHYSPCKPLLITLLRSFPQYS
jgi:hypothetical protein